MKRREFIKYTGAAVALARTANAASGSTMETVPQNTVLEKSFRASSADRNPFDDVDFRVKTISPDGRKIIYSGFWAGQDKFNFRFSSHEIGLFSDVTLASNERDAGLHHHRGTFRVVHYEGSNELLKQRRNPNFEKQTPLHPSRRKTVSVVGRYLVARPDEATAHFAAVARAGKHVYIEKPLATDFDLLLRAYDAAKSAQAAGSIIQVGTQLRSIPGIVGAREVMQCGALGKNSRIEEARDAEKPYWYQYLKNDVPAADVDWREFLGDRKMRPFDADQFSAWFGYYEFCQGPVPQWGAHFLDTAHFINRLRLTYLVRLHRRLVYLERRTRPRLRASHVDLPRGLHAHEFE